MNYKALVAGFAASMLLAPAAAQAQNAGDCSDMLSFAVGKQLDADGYDVGNVCNLSVSDLALIKSLLTEDNMGSRRRIQQILDDAG